ncbi:ATP-binding cassette domain-containing protein [Haloferula rosea]|uniref:ATP-binding cassette domain-containing protein n=1 Tax=Haloferula rosea TaxID=490093 RepID=A0A934RAP7_9BACT|nr:ATP-binding cassette domain-containing protein [Haloferula rosea]MBK1827050.1 ATP-binding cassette domain-containing protein [Haloferula rosea]
MSTTTPQLELSADLSIGYTQPLARTDSSIRLSHGTHFLLARNGRGKTTLLRTIARTLKSLSGTVKHRGKLQYIPENLAFDRELPPVAIFKAMLHKSRLADALALAERIELDVKKPYGKLSTGNRRKTNLIVAEFSIDPGSANVLLLDEPFSGLDAYAREQFEALWKESSEQTLRLVSCHPDYDSMGIPSALMIQDESIEHVTDSSQTWSELKGRLN